MFVLIIFDGDKCNIFEDVNISHLSPSKIIRTTTTLISSRILFEIMAFWPVRSGVVGIWG